MTWFIDTAVIMFAAGREYPLRLPCQNILREVSTGDVDAVTSAEVVQEILHRFSGSGNRATGVAMAEHTLELFSPVLSITHAVMSRMPELMLSNPHLTARDVMHVATCQEFGIETIVSPDRGFDAVAGLKRIDPALLTR
ncbi:MAG: type II toxin-antitoxin system VapC family toxin [Mycobacteriales bacterium]